MGADPRLIHVSDSADVRVVILVQAPDVLAFLFTGDIPSGLLKTARVDQTGHGHFRLEYECDQSLKALKEEIQRRWPKAKIYRLDILGAGAPQPWD